MLINVNRKLYLWILQQFSNLTQLLVYYVQSLTYYYGRPNGMSTELNLYFNLFVL